MENISRAGEPEVKKATGQQTVHKTYVLYSFALLIATVFVFEMHGVRHLFFRVHEGREQRNRVKKRVVREKLPLDTLGAQKHDQEDRVGFIVPDVNFPQICDFRSKSGV